MEDRGEKEKEKEKEKKGLWLSTSFETLPFRNSPSPTNERVAGVPLRKVPSSSLPSRPKTNKPTLLQPRSLEHQVEVLQKRVEELTQMLTRYQQQQSQL